MIAAVQDRPGLAAGDAIGANVAMLTACLGLAALVRPLGSGDGSGSTPCWSSVAGLLALLRSSTGGSAGSRGRCCWPYVALVGLVWWREREPPGLGELAELADMTMATVGGRRTRRRPVAGSGTAAGAGGRRPMLVGGDLAVEGAVRVVEAVGRTDSAIGLTVLALATTAELFALVLAAVRHDVPEIAVAGVVGSAAYNATATLGAAALARPLRTDGMLAAAVVAAVLPLAFAARDDPRRSPRPPGRWRAAGGLRGLRRRRAGLSGFDHQDCLLPGDACDHHRRGGVAAQPQLPS